MDKFQGVFEFFNSCVSFVFGFKFVYLLIF